MQQTESLKVTSETTDSVASAAVTSQAQILEFARQLDRMGRSTEEFLCRQLAQLEDAVIEFEREKSAWRRQLRRESRQLIRQREELRKLKAEIADARTPQVTGHKPVGTKESQLAALVRDSREAPLQILLRPEKASARQVGLLLFELSKLNSEMGGRGLGLEVLEIRTSGKRRLLPRRSQTAVDEILVLKGFSLLPLAARGAHVELDVDLSDRIGNWIAFKSRLVHSDLRSSKLARDFRRSKVADRPKCWSFMSDATQHVNNSQMPGAGYSTAALFTNTPIDSVQQQFERVESCYTALQQDTGLQIYIELQQPDVT